MNIHICSCLYEIWLGSNGECWKFENKSYHWKVYCVVYPTICLYCWSKLVCTNSTRPNVSSHCLQCKKLPSKNIQKLHVYDILLMSFTRWHTEAGLKENNKIFFATTGRSKVHESTVFLKAHFRGLKDRKKAVWNWVTTYWIRIFSFYSDVTWLSFPRFVTATQESFFFFFSSRFCLFFVSFDVGIQWSKYYCQKKFG